MMHMGSFSGMGLGGFGFGGIFMVLFWALVILGVVYLVKYFTGSSKEGHEETALEVLKKRYASGVITKAEYNEKMIVIKEKNE